jgi:hypothetical protein
MVEGSSFLANILFKVKVKVRLTLQQAMKAQRESRDTALLFA